MRDHPRWRLPAAMAVSCALAVSAPAASAQSSHVGARIGYDFDSRDIVLGMNMTVPVASRVEFYPSIDVYTPDRGSRLGFNGDFKIRFPSTRGPEVYVGGGIGLLHRSVNDDSRTDLGANLIMGTESRVGRIHPFLEGRIQLHDESTFRILGGLNFTLSG